MWADAGYDGVPLARYAKAVAAITVEVVKRTSPHSFQVLRRRWVIERTFGWLMRYRRLVRDYERTTANAEAMIYWATVILRRQPVRIVEGRPEGGYTNAFEIICCDCGDHPYQDYSEVSAEFQRIRGPYPIADGVAEYDRRLRLHRQPAGARAETRTDAS